MSGTRTRRTLAGRAVIARASGAIDRVRTEVESRPWWYTTLLAIGFITMLTAVGVLFFGINSGPSMLVISDAVPPVDSLDFGVAISRLVGAPIERGGTIQVLNNGDEFLPALFQAIDGAKASINFSVYIWEDGAISDQLLDRLIRKQSQGVEVRILLDGLGGRKAPDDRLDALEKLGGRVQKFRMPKFGSWTRFHRRNHRRSIVIDGEIGFTGGMAVADQWLGHAQDPEHWRDMMFRLTGALASSLQGAFVDEWASSSAELLVGPRIFPVASATSSAGVERFINKINSPADDDHSMDYFFVLPILAARERVYVTTPYFIPDGPLMKALEKKAQAGLDVRLLLPGPVTDNRMARFSGQSRYDALLKAGVRIYEYQPTFLHAKGLAVDGKWSIVGSPNLNSRSRELDEENAFGILDASLGARLDEVFIADLRHSKEITSDAWRRRNPLLRVLQGASRVLDQQS
jgi:cardiolipin synthase A/B